MQGQNTTPAAPFITITVKVNIKGRWFQPNEQYCYQATVIQQVGCGCGGTPKKDVKHYIIMIGPVQYDIPETYAVESVIPITCEDQDFLKKRADIGDRAPDGRKIHNYAPFVSHPNPNVIANLANIVILDQQ